MTGPTATPALLDALLLVATAWTALLSSQVLLAPRLGAGLAVPVSFALALAVVALAGVPAPRRGSALRLVLGLGLGAASLAPLLVVTGWAGSALELPTPSAPARIQPGVALACIVLAPVFEELLYRERLLGALRPLWGAPAAIVASSVAFALPHGEPWSVLGSFLAGLALGAMRCAARSLALPIGAHAGLNLAAIRVLAAPIEESRP